MNNINDILEAQKIISQYQREYILNGGKGCLKKIIIYEDGKYLLQGMIDFGNNSLKFLLEFDEFKVQEDDVVNFWIIYFLKNGKKKRYIDTQSITKEDLKKAYIIIKNKNKDVIIYYCGTIVGRISDVENLIIMEPYDDFLFCIKIEHEYAYFDYSLEKYDYEFIGKGYSDNPSEIVRDFRVKYTSNKCFKGKEDNLNIIENKFVNFYINNNNMIWFEKIKKYCIDSHIKLIEVKSSLKKDKTVNFIIKVSKQEKKSIDYINFCCSNGGLYGWKIYDVPVEQVIKIINKNNIFLDEEIKKFCFKLSKFFPEILSYVSEDMEEELYTKITCEIGTNLNYSNAIYLIKELKYTYSICRNEIYFYRCEENANYLNIEQELEVEEKLLADISQIENNFRDEKIKERKYKIKWKSEYYLYQIIKKYYQDAIYQYRDIDKLDLQSIDIYIPSLKIGFEYQGKQHYETNNFFDTSSSLIQRKERDLIKLKKCKEIGVKLIEWKYDEEISDENLKKKLAECNIDLKIDREQITFFD